MLLDQSVSYKFAERPLDGADERTSEVRTRQSDRPRQITETAVGQAAERAQQLKL